jgi:hypothetical protein
MNSRRAMIHFLCPCDQIPTVLSADSVGRQIACPWSGARFRVPEGRPFGEAEWQTCEQPTLLLQCLGFFHRPNSARKRRLLACAICRIYWAQIPDARCRRAVEAAERLADGLLGEAERKAALAGAEQVVRAAHSRSAFPESEWAFRTCYTLREPILLNSILYHTHVFVEDGRRGCALVREIFGEPFRPAALDPAWRVWNGGDLPRLAQAIYDERAFDRLPILADALEDAGCAEERILAHCRRSAEHVRGCWVVDLLLGKS